MYELLFLFDFWILSLPQQDLFNLKMVCMVIQVQFYLRVLFFTFKSLINLEFTFE